MSPQQLPATKPSRFASKRDKYVCTTVYIAVPIVLALLAWNWGAWRWWYASLNDRAESFAKIATSSKDAEPTVPPDGPFILGKAAVIEILFPSSIAPPELHPIHRKLPSEIRAGIPDDVKTVIWIKQIIRSVGTYGRQSQYTGSRHVWTVSIIHLSEPPKLIARESFSGGSPARSIRRDDNAKVLDMKGSEPTQEVLEYILSLPRKTAA